MNNIIDYVNENLNTFEEEAFNSVDSLVLSWVSYLHIPKYFKRKYNGNGIKISELFKREHFSNIFRGIVNYENAETLFSAMCSSPRFRNIKLSDFIEQLDLEDEKQFAAMTFHINDDLSYIAYRGTESLLVAWKEDFNMTFKCPVPAQVEALKYFEKICQKFDNTFMLGGHSKGGNLALYAASQAPLEIQNKIIKVFSHDGPGFLPQIIEGEGYNRIESKLNKTVPQASIVGLLLESHNNYNIVTSSQKNYMQHDPFTWLIKDHDFIYLEDIDSSAKYMRHTLTSWLDGVSIEEREQFINSIYGMVIYNDAKTLAEIKNDWKSNVPNVVKVLRGQDKETRELIIKTVKILVKLGIKYTPDLFKS